MLGTAITFVSGYAKHASAYVQQILGNGTSVVTAIIDEQLPKSFMAHHQDALEACYCYGSDRYEVILTSLYEVAKTYGMGNAVKDAVIDAASRLPPKEYLLLAAASGMTLARLTGYIYRRHNAQNHHTPVNNPPVIPANNVVVIQANIAAVVTDVPSVKCKRSTPS